MTPNRVESQREILSSTGALISYSGKSTGRTPKAKRVVVEETSKDKVWWGEIGTNKSPNMPISEEGWRINYHRGISYLNVVP